MCRGGVCIFGVLTVNPVNPCSSFVLTLCFLMVNS